MSLIISFDKAGNISLMFKKKSNFDVPFYIQLVIFYYQVWKVRDDDQKIITFGFSFTNLLICEVTQKIDFFGSGCYFLVSSRLYPYELSFSFNRENQCKSQPHKMVKHTQTICRLLPTIYLSVFDHLVVLALKGLC